MEEIYPTSDDDTGDFLKKMHIKVKEEEDPVTALVGDVRVVMFIEKRFVDSHYDGPK